MITFRLTADQWSLGIEREGKHLGHIMWHHPGDPRLVLDFPFSELSLSELKKCVERLEMPEDKRRWV